jgi:hypothetical protein
MTDDAPVTRENYTWELAFRDIAVQSPLTVSEVVSLVWPIKQDDLIHPYDIVLPLVKISQCLNLPLGGENASRLAVQLAALIKLAKESG